MKEILIDRSNENTTIVLLENGKIIERYEDIEKRKYLEENIYLGIVKDILPGMQAAFIDIGEEKNTFIHLKDILPKVDITKEREESNKKIDTVVKTGQKLLVQIKRDATTIKGAKVSTHISIASKYIVLMPETEIVTVSQKISDDEKSRLIEIVKNIIPKNYGAIIRTSSSGKSKDEIREDLDKTINKWNEIKQKAKELNAKAPILIENGNSFIKKMFIDLINDDIDRVILNNKIDYEIVNNILNDLIEYQKTKVELRENEDILKMYDVSNQIEKSKLRKIYLNCGGFITIDKTEALTAIDVNSGKYTGKKDLEETILKVNKEATIEIAKQIRLRDIGGVIVIDYIDMNKEEHKNEIEELLKEKLKADRSKTQVMGFSRLNLLEMTRKHIRSEE